jgi:hypothetical protein
MEIPGAYPFHLVASDFFDVNSSTIQLSTRKINNKFAMRKILNSSCGSKSTQFRSPCSAAQQSPLFKLPYSAQGSG